MTAAMAAPIVVRFDEPPPLGITWQLAREEGGGTCATIETIHAGTPAASKPGLRAGMRLLDVDGTPVAGDAAPPGLSPEQVTDLLRSPAFAARPLTLTLREASPRLVGGQTVPDGTQLAKPTWATAREFHAAVGDVMQSAGVSRGEARAALHAHGLMLDTESVSSPENAGNTLRLGPQTSKRRKGGVAACCSNPSKSAAHSLPIGTSFAAPPERRRSVAPPVTFLDTVASSEDCGSELPESLGDSALQTVLTIPRTDGAGYGLALSSKTLRVADLIRELDGSPGPAELAGAELGFTLVQVNGQPARNLMTAATLFAIAASQSVECVFENPGRTWQTGVGSNAGSLSVLSNPVRPAAASTAARWAHIQSTEQTSAAARLLLCGWGSESAPRLALQVFGSVAEFAVAGPPSTWLQSGLSWRAPFASLMLVVHVGAFISSSSGAMQQAATGAKMRSTAVPVEAYTRANSSISRTAGGTLACVVLLVGLLAEPMVKPLLARSAELQWFNSSNLAQSGEAIGYCARGVIANDFDHAEEANPLVLSWLVLLNLVECFQSALAASGEYQVITLVVRLLSLAQSACLLGWWVCSRYGSAQVYSLCTKSVQSRLQLSRKELIAALERIQAGCHLDGAIDSLVSAFEDVERCGSEGIAVLGIGSGAIDANEVTAASATSVLGWLLLIASGVASLCLSITVRADDTHVAITEWVLRVLVAEAILWAALYMTSARRALDTCSADLATALAAAQADIANAQTFLDTSALKTSPPDAFSRRRDEVSTLVAASRLRAHSLQLSPRIRDAHTTWGIGVIELGVKLAMLVLPGLALRQAVNIVAVRLAIATDGQIKQLSSFLRDDVLPEVGAVANDLATAGSEVAGTVQTFGKMLLVGAAGGG